MRPATRSIPLRVIPAAPAMASSMFSGVASWTTPSEWLRFEMNGRSFLYVARGSHIYEVDAAAADRLHSVDGTSELDRIAALGVPVVAPPRGWKDGAPSMRSLSLAVAQTCNLGCSYCYAQQGEFGGERQLMPAHVATAAIDRLFAENRTGERVHLSFLGGEPLINRQVLRLATEHAQRRSREHRIEVGFSITTNGTLLTIEDGAFFEAHGFAVTISLDGVAETHDQLRPYRDRRGSYDHIMTRLAPLLQFQRRMQVSARVTVTPRNLDLRRTLDEFIAMGFHSVGFSPMLASPTAHDEMQAADLEEMLRRMIDCGREFERQVVAGVRYPFTNMTNAMREIHQGACRPYPCGAGAEYFGVSASGELSACHRFVNDDAGAMGTLSNGVDVSHQQQWLSERHVDRQEPCNSCWARYLCGGGCHHEVSHRGRMACDYIRGWLEYTLTAYARLSDARPQYFAPSGRQSSQVSDVLAATRPQV